MFIRKKNRKIDTFWAALGRIVAGLLLFLWAGPTALLLGCVECASPSFTLSPHESSIPPACAFTSTDSQAQRWVQPLCPLLSLHFSHRQVGPGVGFFFFSSPARGQEVLRRWLAGARGLRWSQLLAPLCFLGPRLALLVDGGTGCWGCRTIELLLLHGCGGALRLPSIFSLQWLPCRNWGGGKYRGEVEEMVCERD